MNRSHPAFLRRTISGWLAAAALAALPLGAAAQITAPVHNWKLPFFTNEGYRTLLALGQEARQLDFQHYEIVGLNLTTFVGDASNRIEGVILSPAATFDTGQKTAHGEKRVRFIRYSLSAPDVAEVEASGERWTYWHADKKISLEGNVHVTFRAEMKDLLR